MCVCVCVCVCACVCVKNDMHARTQMHTHPYTRVRAPTLHFSPSLYLPACTTFFLLLCFYQTQARNIVNASTASVELPHDPSFLLTANVTQLHWASEGFPEHSIKSAQWFWPGEHGVPIFLPTISQSINQSVNQSISHSLTHF